MGPLPSDPEGPVGTPAPSQPPWAPLQPEIFLVGVLFLQRPQADSAWMTGGGEIQRVSLTWGWGLCRQMQESSLQILDGDILTSPTDARHVLMGRSVIETSRFTAVS